ncbi:calcium-binding protein [Ruminococcus sp.]|uniref:calcium-binding protein n=1 Tax=Ruminococcus sp. TaxID=41978 RepID=UPI0025ECEA94|nr:calcium-binding protein [Ruminococcus sp.]
MKKELLKRCISAILSLTLLVQFILIYPVSASAFSGTPGYNLPYHTTLKPNESISWTIAKEVLRIVDEYNDDLDLTWASNYFHNQVEKRIGRLYDVEVEKPTCYYTKSYPDGKTQGRADLSKSIGSYTYIWEVKPVVYCLNATLRKNTFENQLDRYIDSDSTYRNGCKSNLSFGKETFNSIDQLFSITYEDAGNGLIVYTFDFLWDNIKKNVPTEIWIALLAPLLEKLKSSSRQSGNAPEPGFNPSDAVIVAETFAEISAAIAANALNQFRKMFEGWGSSNPVEQPILGDDTYYIKETELDRLKEQIEALATTAVVSAAVSAWVLKSDTSLGQFEDAKALVLKIIERLIKNKATQTVMIGGICYYILTPTDVKAIEDFSEYFNNYESFDPESDEWNFEIIKGDVLKKTSSSTKSMNDHISTMSFNYETAQKQYQRDPLIINFSGTDEIEFTSLDEGINFDLDNNGFAEKTAWIKNNDGFLAIDLNGNGKIDNGGELFGDCFVMSNGITSSNGFEALRSLDTNENGKIDDNDELVGEITVDQANEDGEYTLFDQLLVWFSSDGEDRMVSLKSLNVDYIDLNCFPDPYNSDDDNETERSTRKEETSYVFFKDGTDKKHISEFWFDVNTTTTIHDGEITVGNVKTIDQAIADDETGELFDLCLSFNYTDDIAKKHYYLKKILYFITDSADIEINSRGGNIDARDLHVIEAFMGHEFNGVNGKNPNAPAAEMLKDIYNNIELDYYNILNLKMSFGGYSLFIAEDEMENISFENSSINTLIDEMINNNEADTDILIYDLGVYLKSYDKINKTNEFDKFKEYYSAKSQKFAEIIDLIGSVNTFVGTENNDKYSGTSGIDFIFDDSGNNTLNGSNSDDRFYSGYGNDIMNGGSGNDNYYFGMYTGDDIINDTEGNNTIVFIDGLSAEDFDTSISMNGKFILTNKYTGDTITLNDFISHPLNYDFASYDELQTIGGREAREVIEGTEGDDELDASDGFNIFYGRDGKDTIYGGENIDFMYGGSDDDILLGRNGTNIMFGEDGNDTIEDGDHSSYLNGGSGNDILKGAGGNDFLDGGTGDDFLNGERGDDTYIFAKGYDSDTVAASVGHDTIIIHNYRVSDMNNIREANRDLTINFGKDTGDKIIITNFFGSVDGRSFTFIFDDGTVLEGEDITVKTAPIYGTDGNETINGTSEDDTIDSGAGDDYLCGCDGEDTYIFGKGYGNDIISEWGSDHSFVEFKDIKSDEITISVDSSQSLVISINDTEDSIKFGSWSWSSSTYTLIFADGAEGYVDRDTNKLVLTKEPDPVEEDIADSDADGSEVSDNSVEETDVTEQEIDEAA